jgi:hypothetical protein
MPRYEMMPVASATIEVISPEVIIITRNTRDTSLAHP